VLKNSFDLFFLVHKGATLIYQATDKGFLAPTISQELEVAGVGITFPKVHNPQTLPAN
jgi:hypothetical protein